MTALRTCPHCFAPVRSDGRPTCLCAAADAADFDPLRIRPYVSLPDEDEGPWEGEDFREGQNWAGGFPGRGEDLDELPGFDAAVHIADPRAHTAEGPPYAAEHPMPGPRRRPGPTSKTFSSAIEEPTVHTTAPSAPIPSRSAPAPAASRRKRALPAVLVAAGAAVAATAVLISADALSGGTQDRAAPPDGGTVSPTAAFPTSDEPAPTPSGTPSSSTPSRSPSSSATGIGTPQATVKLSQPAQPRPPAPTRASGSVTDSPDGRSPSAPPTGPIVLREGSSGPEVAELQGRLRQLAFYLGAQDGRYDADVRDAVARYQQSYGVAGDPEGVYGAQTRASLESRTQAP